MVGLCGQDGWEQSLEDDVSTPLDLIVTELGKAQYYASSIEIDLGSFHEVIQKQRAGCWQLVTACSCILVCVVHSAWSDSLESLLAQNASPVSAHVWWKGSEYALVFLTGVCPP